MPEFSKGMFTSDEDNGFETDNDTAVGDNVSDTTKKQLKRELIAVFRKFGYLGDMKDYEVRIKTTSGNIAWINIRGIETIK